MGSSQGQPRRDEASPIHQIPLPPGREATSVTNLGPVRLRLTALLSTLVRPWPRLPAQGQRWRGTRAPCWGKGPAVQPRPPTEQPCVQRLSVHVCCVRTRAGSHDNQGDLLGLALTAGLWQRGCRDHDSHQWRMSQASGQEKRAHRPLTDMLAQPTKPGTLGV